MFNKRTERLKAKKEIEVGNKAETKKLRGAETWTLYLTIKGLNLGKKNLL
jgi:hypothetical protein